MISTVSVIGCILSLLVSTLLPVGFIVVYGLRHKGRSVGSAWILGALGFVITQMVIRIPILNAIAALDGYAEWITGHPILYALALGLTAGLFEFAGRFAVAKYIQKKGRLNGTTALAAGLGHGGIEAILLVGLTYINNLVLMFTIQSGSFDTLVAQTAAAGADTAALLAARDLLLGTPAMMFYLGGFERLMAMTAHVGMSTVVCYSVFKKRAGLGFLICVGYHAFIDTVCGLLSIASSKTFGAVISQTAMVLILYPILTVCAALALFVTLKIRRRWTEEQEVSHVQK